MGDWNRELHHSDHHEDIERWRARAEKAEADAARLREQLDEAMSYVRDVNTELGKRPAYDA
jgi:transglutaminase-like putative cysteine protease